MKGFRFLLLFIVATCAGLIQFVKANAEPTVITYNNPLAYIGVDGNVYITSLDGTAATAITSDAGPRGYGMSDESAFGALRWSPDGTKMAFTGANHGYYPARLN